MSEESTTSSIIIPIVIAILCFVIIIGLVISIKGGPLQTIMDSFTDQGDTLKYEEDCAALNTDAGSFTSDKLDVFEKTLNYDVNDIQYFGLFFNEGWGSAWYLEWWKVTCESASEGKEVELGRYTVGQWVEGKTMFAKIENRGYKLDLLCGKTVKIYTKTGKDWWADSSGQASLCYMRERTKSE